MSDRIKIGPAGEVHAVRIDYTFLDPITGKSDAKTFTADVLAPDAAQALVIALDHVRNHPPPAGKIWGIVANVSVQSDVLRDQLNDTFPHTRGGELPAGEDAK